MRIAVEDPDQPAVLALLAASDAYHAALYPAESNHLLDVAALKSANVVPHVVRLEGCIVGFGAVMLFAAAGYAELKRMFLAPAARGRGIGRRLLAALEVCARERGLRCIRLETGVRQPAALALYRAAGYGEIAPFGTYRPDPLSLFLEKRLGP